MLRFAIPGIELTERVGGAKIPARYTDLTPERAVKLVAPWWDEQAWLPEGLSRAQDVRWDWPRFAGESITDELPDCVGLQTPEDGQIQGALWLNQPLTSHLAPGRLALHVERVATAPRNREGVAQEPRFKAVGRALMLYSIAYSYAFQLGGRVILSSLPDAIDFYKGLGLIETGIYDNEALPIYEVTPEVAANMLTTYHLL